MDLSIIVVNWNSKEFLRNCLNSIKAQTRGIDYEVVVIDSGSFDGCEDMLGKCFPCVRFVQCESNVGFARANNLAFKVSIGDYVLFLNPDTTLVGPAINVMLQYAKALTDVGAVGCRLLNGDGSIQMTSIQAFPTILSQFLTSARLMNSYPRWPIWGTAALFGATERPSSVDAISGACLMLRRDRFQEVGRFSEDYFMYAEDLDLCYKLKAAGLVNYYIPHATVVHFGGGSSGKAVSEFAVVLMRESVWRFLSKTRGNAYGVAYRAATATLAMMRILLLVAFLPFQSMSGGGLSWRESIRKWRAILGWSLGLKPAMTRPRH